MLKFMINPVLSGKTRIILLFIITFCCSYLSATIINIPADQPTIQAGINIAVDGDTVLVQPGTYVENINYNGKNITVGSLFLTTQYTSYISQTIIDGGGSGSVVKFENEEDTTAVLSGFTIKNGNAYYGGGIHCWTSSPCLKNVTIIENSSHYGGGIYCSGSSPCLENVTITGNSATDYLASGGGISCRYYSSPSLENVTIIGNSAHYGGGISCWESNPSLENVTIIENSADDYGGGIYCYKSSPSLENVTIIGNSADNYGGGIYCRDNSSLSFESVNRCNIFLNYAGSGNDLYVSYCPTINVILDTFSVLQPYDYFAYPLDNFTFDIQNAKIEQVNHDLYVSPSGSDDNNGLSPAEPLQTICYALAKIVSNSTNPHAIYLANGTYSPSQTGEHFPLNCKSYVSIIGEEESLTILDGDELSRILYCRNDNNFSVTLLTITNGSAYNGGGIYCYESSPSLENVTITGNSASYRGGGIYCGNSSPSLVNVTVTENSADNDGGGIYCRDNSSPSLENVTIAGNSAEDGGGIYCYSSSPSLENVTIIENSVAGGYLGSYGGGLSCSNSSPSLLNVTIIGNIADYGGGLSCSNSSPSLLNVTITDNFAYRGGGISCRSCSSPSLENVTITENSASKGGGIYCYESNPGLVNCILWDDSPQEIYISSGSVTVTYSDIQGGWTGEGNIDADPLFLDPANGDYHLTENSPCIDAGDPDSPLDPDGTRADMGAYYYNQGDIILIWPGDTDYSGIVNEEDILPIGVYFRKTGSHRVNASLQWVAQAVPTGWDSIDYAYADCNGDGEVNITDVLAICLNWNKTHSTVLESPFIPNNLEQYRDNFVEIYNSLGNSEIEIKIRNHIAEKFDLPIIEIVKVNKLYQNYPNPFNPDNPGFNRGGTIISFSLTTANAENAKIEIYNIKGQKVRNLECDESLVTKAPMYRDYSITWDGRDENNKPVSSGIYFYQLRNNNKVIDCKKMLIIR